MTMANGDNVAEAAKSTKQAPQKSQTAKNSRKPTQEEIEEKRRQRAEKKQREAEERQRLEKEGHTSSTLGPDGKPLFALRKWSKVRNVDESGAGAGGSRKKLRILSWNILAQGLVRRKLFPGSDNLKWKDRQAGLLAEFVSHDWDIGAFQEVDRIEAHGPNLERNGRKFIYAKGYSDKQHGLLVAWRTAQANDGGEAQDRYTFEDKPEQSKVIFFDREHVDDQPGNPGKRRALSRVTRNVALLVALRCRGSDQGVIVATTHLFWHPMHAYERVRQTGILKRNLLHWRQEHPDWSDWPLIVAGDFNDQPHSANYKLVTGEQLTPHSLKEVEQSTVVHQSVDELSKKMAEDNTSSTADEAIVENGHAAQADGIGDGPGDTDEKLDEECDEAGDDEEGEDDQILKNCRTANDNDGLLTIEELVQLHDLSRPPPGSEVPKKSAEENKQDPSQFVPKAGLISLYGKHFNNLESDQEGNYFGSEDRWRERHDDESWSADAPNPHLGSSFEPMYTLFSTLFALTLDYIFLFPKEAGQSEDQKDAKETEVTVTALLPTHRTQVLQPGVPRLGVCASDHTAIAAEIMF